MLPRHQDGVVDVGHHTGGETCSDKDGMLKEGCDAYHNGLASEIADVVTKMEVGRDLARDNSSLNGELDEGMKRMNDSDECLDKELSAEEYDTSCCCCHLNLTCWDGSFCRYDEMII